MFHAKALFSSRATFAISANCMRHLKRDPGIASRKKLVSLINTQEDFTDFEEMESDFMNAHKSHKEHVREMEQMKEKVKYYIVKQKYFKTNYPNFLTWHDKEQIRYLHRTNPEEWTIERLSEGFPALPETIIKIVKSNWIKSKQNKITNHDSSVQRNWKLFKEGKLLDLPENLVKHLNKFSNRALNFKPFILPESQGTVQAGYTTNGEFSEILRSYQNIKTKSPQIESKEIISGKISKHPLQETYLESPVSKRNPVTLDQLEEDLKKKTKLDDEDKRIIMNIKPELTTQKQEPFNVLDQNKYQTSTAIQMYKKTERDLSHLNYPEKITIPKNIFKKGFTYKLNDCYYDDDGEFLYRVPGME